MAVREGMVWDERVYPPYADGTVLVKQTVRQDGEFFIGMGVTMAGIENAYCLDKKVSTVSGGVVIVGNS